MVEGGGTQEGEILLQSRESCLYWFEISAHVKCTQAFNAVNSLTQPSSRYKQAKSSD